MHMSGCDGFCIVTLSHNPISASPCPWRQTFPFQGKIPTQKNWQSRIPDVPHDSLGPSLSSFSGALGRLREVGDSG